MLVMGVPQRVELEACSADSMFESNRFLQSKGPRKFDGECGGNSMEQEGPQNKAGQRQREWEFLGGCTVKNGSSLPGPDPRTLLS